MAALGSDLTKCHFHATRDGRVWCVGLDTDCYVECSDDGGATTLAWPDTDLRKLVDTCDDERPCITDLADGSLVVSLTKAAVVVAYTDSGTDGHTWSVL